MNLDRLKESLKKTQERFSPDKLSGVKKIRDIKRPWLRRLLVSAIVIISVGAAIIGGFRAEESLQQEIRDNYISAVNKKESLSNWSVIKNFKLKNGDTAGIFSYQNKDGFNILIYNVTKKEVILKEAINTQGQDVSNSSTILGAQLLLYLLENEKDFKLDKIEKIEGVGFYINGTDYKLENQYSRLTNVNGKDLDKLYNVHLTQPAEKRLLNNAGVSNYEDLLIGRVDKISDSEVVITARLKDSHDVYEIHTMTDNKVKLIVNPGISKSDTTTKGE